MSGIPDAVVEAAAEAIRDMVVLAECERDDIARAALAAAEGPWREHLAAQTTCCPCPRHSHQCTSYCHGGTE